MSEESDLISQLAERLGKNINAGIPDAAPHSIALLNVDGVPVEFIVQRVDRSRGEILVTLQDHASWKQGNTAPPCTYAKEWRIHNGVHVRRECTLTRDHTGMHESKEGINFR